MSFSFHETKHVTPSSHGHIHAQTYTHAQFIRRRHEEGFPLWLSRLRTQHSILKDAGSIPGLAQWAKVPACCKLHCRWQTQLRSMLLWLWLQLPVEAPVQVLVWELPCAAGVVLKKKKKMQEYTHAYFLLYFYSFIRLFLAMPTAQESSQARERTCASSDNAESLTC